MPCCERQPSLESARGKNSLFHETFLFIPFPDAGIFTGARPGIDNKISSNSRTGEATSQASPQEVHHSVLSPVLAKYKQYLQSCYNARVLAQADKYLPTLESPYINLAMIRRGRYNHEQRDEFTRQTLHGGIDEILQSKTPINIEDLLTPEDSGRPVRFILVEGPPGIGKSTFAWEVCRRWDEIESLRDYHIVVLLKLREKWVLNATSLAQLFRCPFHPEFSRNVVQELHFNKCLGPRLLLVLDGFDEVSHSFHENSVIKCILCREFLPECTIILTTRPVAKATLESVCQPRVDKHVEIIGFTEEERMRYITEVFSKEPELQVNFLKYMFLVPHIKSMMYIPLNCAIIAQVYYESQSSHHLAIPKTRTQLYKALTHSLLVRHMKMKEGNREYTSMLPECLDKESMKNFKTLAKFAFDTYHKGKSRKVTFFKEDIPEGLVHFGFMNESTEMYAGKGMEQTFSFLHLSLQEYLAAWHLADSYSIEFHVAYHRLAVDLHNSIEYQGTSKEEETLISSLKRQRSSLVEPAIFLAGITGWRCLSEDDRNHWEMYLSEYTAHITEKGILLQCLYEALNQTIIPLYFTAGTGRRNILIGSLPTSTLLSPLTKKTNLLSCHTHVCTPYRCYALSYCLANSSDEFDLSLVLSKDDDIALLETFVKGLDDHCQCTIPKINHVKIGIESKLNARFLFWIMKANCWGKLKQLNFVSQSSVDRELAQKFLSKLVKVQYLYIHIGCPTSWEWLVALKLLRELKVLHITNKNGPIKSETVPYKLNNSELTQPFTEHDNWKSTMPEVKRLIVQLEYQNCNEFLFWLTKVNCWNELQELNFKSQHSINSDLAKKCFQSLVKLRFVHISAASWEWLPELKFLSDCKLEGFHITNKFNFFNGQEITWSESLLDLEFPSLNNRYSVYHSIYVGIDSLLKSVHRSNKITRIVLPPNLSRETMAGVRNILLHCSSLTTLELKRTRLGYDGILYICSALRNNTSLRYLVIHDDLQLPTKREKRVYGSFKYVALSSMKRVTLPGKTTCTDFLLELNNILKDNTTLEEMKIQSGLFLPLSAGEDGEYCQWTGLGPLQQFNVGAVGSGMSPNLRRSFSSSDLTQPQTTLFWDRQHTSYIFGEIDFVNKKEIDFKALFPMGNLKEMTSFPSFTAPDTEVLQSFSGLDPRLQECLEISNIEPFVNRIREACWGMFDDIIYHVERQRRQLKHPNTTKPN